jgi:hypothetical protein
MTQLLARGFRSRLVPVLLCTLGACGDGARTTPPRDAAAQPTAITYDRELATLTASIDDGTLAIDRQNGDAPAALESVSLLIERARLTGNFDDFRKAAALLDTASERMDPGSYPCLAHARLHFALRRIAAARPSSTAARAPSPGEIAGLRRRVPLRPLPAAG